MNRWLAVFALRGPEVVELMPVSLVGRSSDTSMGSFGTKTVKHLNPFWPRQEFC